jgi:hypothetical protein
MRVWSAQTTRLAAVWKAPLVRPLFYAVTVAGLAAVAVYGVFKSLGPGHRFGDRVQVQLYAQRESEARRPWGLPAAPQFAAASAIPGWAAV